MKGILLIAIPLLFFEMWALAPVTRASGQAISQPYKITSDNGEFYSWVTFMDSTNPNDFWEPKGMLRVYTFDSTLIWQQPIRVNKNSRGILSNDGVYFCYLENYFNSNGPVIDIYRKDKESISITGKQFEIPSRWIQPNHTKQLWLKDSPLYNSDKFIRKLNIYTIDSKSWSINLETGKIYSAENDLKSLVLTCLFIWLVVLIIFIKIGADILISPASKKL